MTKTTIKNRMQRIKELQSELAELQSPIGEDELYSHIGMMLKQYREACGMTQIEAANVCKMTRTTITNLEAGRQYMPLHKLVWYCQALGCSIVDILPEWAKES